MRVKDSKEGETAEAVKQQKMQIPVPRAAATFGLQLKIKKNFSFVVKDLYLKQYLHIHYCRHGKRTYNIRRVFFQCGFFLLPQSHETAPRD